MATLALIPGGGGDPWEWHRLVPELEARGHEALAIRLPSEDDSAGWSEYADAVVDAWEIAATSSSWPNRWAPSPHRSSVHGGQSTCSSS